MKFKIHDFKSHRPRDLFEVILTTNVQTQELFSSVCGQYCIFYMCLRARGHSMDDIVQVLDIQGEGSNRFVTCFVKLFYGVEY